ncbi:MAG: hypothetical protein NC489_08300 [Ruminococcus flavefaciens]|nr:hypothetical protein [Ruminococcus flavefaciens]
MKRFHIGIMFMIGLVWIILMRYTIEYLMRPVPKNPNWMQKDTRAKAIGCAILYGILIPGIAIMAWLSTDGIYTSRLDPSLGGAFVLSLIVNIVYLIKHRRNSDNQNVRVAGFFGYILPVTTLVSSLIQIWIFNIDI